MTDGLKAYQRADVNTLVGLYLDDDPRGIEEIIAEDTEYEEAVVKEVDIDKDGKHASILRDDGWSFIITIPDDLEAPQVGQLVKVYGGGIGYLISGYSFDGVVYKYETKWEQFAKRITMLADSDRKRRSFL